MWGLAPSPHRKGGVQVLGASLHGDSMSKCPPTVQRPPHTHTHLKCAFVFPVCLPAPILCQKNIWTTHSTGLNMPLDPWQRLPRATCPW